MAAPGHRGMPGTPDHHYLAHPHLWDFRCFRAGVRREERSVPLIERNRALELRGTRAIHPGPRATKRRPTAQAGEPQNADRKGPRCSTQRAGIAPPHAEGDGLSGATSDGEFGFISGPAAFVGGVPLTRAMNPWAMPEAST